MLAALKKLQANQTWARVSGAGARHRASELPHPDTVGRAWTWWVMLTCQATKVHMLQHKCCTARSLLEAAMSL